MSENTYILEVSKRKPYRAYGYILTQKEQWLLLLAAMVRKFNISQLVTVMPRYDAASSDSKQIL